MNDTKKLLAFAAAALLLLVAAAVWFVQAPTTALAEIKAAAQRGDSVELDRRVDFPALRASVKSLVMDAAGGTEPVATGRIGSAIARVMAGAIAAPVVEALVTPEAIALMFQGVLPAGRPAPAQHAGAPSGPRQVTMSREWDGLSSVRVRLRGASPDSPGIAFVMRREGLVNWRLVGVER